MKIYIHDRDKTEKEKIEELVEKNYPNLDISKSEETSEVIITYGGDGTFLHAERKFPGIPKLIVRHRSLCKTCSHGNIEEALELLNSGKFKIKEYNKIKALIKKNNKTITKHGANDIVVSNRLPYRALRFLISISKDKKNILEKEFIGDGIIVASSFGSTGYFHSVTKKTFKEKMGIAFNNTLEKQECISGEDLEVKLKVLRSDAYVSSDNNPSLTILNQGDEILIRKSEKIFRIVV